MPSDSEWIAGKVANARTDQPLVTDAVADHIEDLLKGQLMERQLPKKEIGNAAKELIARMVPGSIGDAK